jgi:hypothetical protein
VIRYILKARVERVQSSIPGKGQEPFQTPHRPRVHPAFFPMSTGRARSPRVMLLEHGCDHSHLSSTKDKNCGAVPSLPHTSSWRSQFFKHLYLYTVEPVQVKEADLIYSRVQLVLCLWPYIEFRSLEKARGFRKKDCRLLVQTEVFRPRRKKRILR